MDIEYSKRKEISMAFSEINIALDIIIATLNKYGVEDWYNILSDKKDRLNKAFDSGNTEWIISQLEELIEVYGGMGSFTDLFITNKAGHRISDEKTSEINQEFRKFRTDLFLALQKEISRLNHGPN